MITNRVSIFFINSTFAYGAALHVWIGCSFLRFLLFCGGWLFKHLPKGQRGVGGCYVDGVLGDGVGEGDFACVQADAGVGIASAVAVFQVAFDGGQRGGELAADLVVATSVEVDFY